MRVLTSNGDRYELHRWSEANLSLPGIRVIPPENLHVTTSFFGEVDDRCAAWLVKVVAGCEGELIAVESDGLRAVGRVAIAVVLNRVFGPTPGQHAAPAASVPTGVYIQIMRTRTWEELIAIEPSSIAADERIILLWQAALTSRPTSNRQSHGHFHVTLARTKGPSPGLHEARLPTLAFELRSYHLYLSELDPGGSRYTILATAQDA